MLNESQHFSINTTLVQVILCPINVLLHLHSTVAASINALATVTFEDLVKKGFPNVSEKMSTWISKGLCRYP